MLVEEDAVSFRPFEEKITSYTRVTPNSKKKGKGAVAMLSEDDPDVVVYEVWHVCVYSPIAPVTHPFDNYLRQRGTTLDSENTTGGRNCSFFSTSRLAPSHSRLDMYVMYLLPSVFA